MRSTSLLSIVLPFAAVLGACTEVADTGDDTVLGTLTDGGLYRVHATAVPDPPVSGDATLEMALTDPADAEAPVVAATVEVTPWMTSMNHGVMGEVVVTELGEGTYEATWSYPMPGWWDVTVEVQGHAGSDTLVLGFDVQ